MQNWKVHIKTECLYHINFISVKVDELCLAIRESKGSAANKTQP